MCMERDTPKGPTWKLINLGYTVYNDIWQWAIHDGIAMKTTVELARIIILLMVAYIL